MLRTLTLKNFRKHEDVEFNFVDGLTVIRGANEQGKTTIGESVMYALFGANMLRESLDAVVTYDKPESSLKVALTFQLDGVDYKIVRGKSGAELTYADQIVTGQRETRLFVERLLGCSADTAKLLMFADQNSIRGVLDKGGTAANGLVETLAQLGLIEELVDKVQAQLPAGNTKAVDAQIETLKAAIVMIPEMPSDSEILAAGAEISAVSEKIVLTERRKPADQVLADAEDAVRVRDAAKVEIARLEARKTQISATLAKTVTRPQFTLSQLEQTRKDAANLQEQTRRWKASKTVFPACEDEWEGTLESLEAFKQTAEGSIDTLPGVISNAEKQIAVAQSKKINEKTCAFCQKDLSDVPEVERVNMFADATITTLSRDLEALKTELTEQRSNLKTVQRILKVTAERKQLAGEYWALDDRLPPNPSWIGEPATMPGESNLPAMEKEWSTYQTALAQREVLETELAGIVIPDLPDVSEAEATIKLNLQVKQELQDLAMKAVQVQGSLSTAEARYQAKLATRDSAIAQNENNAKALQQLTETRDSMHRHNELIRKLRNARPEIASKMWGTVLGAISRYFTQIRGEQSVVTRDADGFKVNGRSVAGLSGSTNDALGLAIRMALSKLFLPGVPLLFLDESFAGADDTRELAGVGTLAGAGFSQVLLVTHSSLPEQVADNLITL
jgi:DNA repair exonuclease SbcCD ATPase subunit